MNLDAITAELKKLHLKYDRTESKLDKVLSFVEKSRYSVVIVGTTVFILLLFGYWLGTLRCCA